MSEVKTNKISSLASNNDITIDPDGTGDVVVASDNLLISTVGGVGVNSTDNIFINATNTGIKLLDDEAAIIPCSSGGSNNHNALDVGITSVRWKDLYLQGGISAVGVYNNTTGTSANLVVDSAGGFARSTSSQRYKNTIADATHGLTELLTLRPVTYKHNGNGDTVFGGLIAEEVHTAGLSEFVDYSQDADGNDQPEALHYANMVSLCIKAIQEQQVTITALTARITALESE